MPLYWINENIHREGVTYAKNQFHQLGDFPAGSIRKLIDKGVVRELRTPPLSIVKELKKYEKVLAKRGIVNCADFYVADSDELAGWLKLEVGEVGALKARLAQLIRPDYQEDDCCG